MFRAYEVVFLVLLLCLGLPLTLDQHTPKATRTSLPLSMTPTRLTRGRLAETLLAAGFEVAVTNEEVNLGAVYALLVEIPGYFFDDRHRAVPAAGAAYS
jgi:hypothetical protein